MFEFILWNLILPVVSLLPHLIKTCLCLGLGVCVLFTNWIRPCCLDTRDEMFGVRSRLCNPVTADDIAPALGQMCCSVGQFEPAGL